MRALNLVSTVFVFFSVGIILFSSADDEDSCQVDSCMNNGTCINSGGKPFCMCQPPFEGPRCEKSICNPNPCQNNGSCEVNEYDYKCNCKEPYFGVDCEIVLDYCADNPCKNGGSCRMESDHYECECVKPYTGKNCEEVIDLCYESPCENGGSCLLTSDNYKCECPSPYTGKNCQEEFQSSTTTRIELSRPVTKPECFCGEQSSHCYFDFYGKKQCVCLPGYAQLRDRCSVCNCGENSRSCLFDKDGKIVCYCKAGFKQKNNTCQEMCLDDFYCLNGGTCTREKDGNFCKCMPDFSGSRCQTDDACEYIKSRCDSMGAMCRRKGLIRVCECPTGKAYSWKSGICEDICDDRKCIYGDCVITEQTYECVCYKGYTGKYCDRVVGEVRVRSDSAAILVILTSGIVIFLILSIVFICLFKKLERKIREQAHGHTKA